MLELLILRHAKAAKESSTHQDKDRLLVARGLEDARQAGRALARFDLIPDLILCSTAARARQTSDALLETLEQTVDVAWLDSLYLAESRAIRDIVRKTGRGGRVLVIGHNPGLEDFVAAVCGGKSLSVHLPTSALAVVALRVSEWTELAFGSGQLLGLLTPAIGLAP